MKIWLVTSGEPLPIDDGPPRLLRAGLLAGFLRSAGHDVVWWTAAFDHRVKRRRPCGPDGRASCDGIDVRLLWSPGYRSNISISRLWDHARLGLAFRRLARAESRPDVILASFPPLELCAAAVAYGRKRGVATGIDVRDLWPQLFTDCVPKFFAPAANLALAPYWRLARYCCRASTSITAPSQKYVDWALGLAGRPASGFDRAFPFAYPNTPPAASAIRRAEQVWDSLGVGARSSGELRVCFIGTLGSQFEFRPVVEAAQRLNAAGRRVRFIVCGSGEKATEWTELAADCPNILFPGWVDAASIWELMRRCDVGLAPYRDTPNFALNLPNKPIEYLSAALPVATSLGGGAISQMLQRYGCGWVYTDGAHLASSLAALAEEPGALRRLSENARGAFLREFAAETVYPAMAEYLAQLARRTPYTGSAIAAAGRVYSRKTTLMQREFGTVTEIPSDGATADQFQIMYTRYALAAKYAEGKDVLEVACGAGVGLGLLARVARRTVAGDIDERNLAVAHRTYAERSGVALNLFDAQSLPFRSASFDVVVLYEALYYLPAAEAFFREAWRVLRPGGTLLTSTVNCRWAEFNPSPFSVKYYDAAELSRALESRGFGVEMYASFPASNGGVRSGVIGALRRLAVSFHLIPRTMKGKQMLKRLFYGRLRPIPAELAPDCFPSAKLERLESLQKAEGYRFLYAVGTRKDGDKT